MPLEADDCLLVIRGAVSHVNMPSFCGGCRFLEFKSASDLWPLMFADARVFRQHFLDRTILYATNSSC